MRLLDVSFETPEENLAFDEAILNAAENEQAGETLRFWESRARFVVLGVSQVLADEVREEACDADSVPIMRRCSAGGCVLQGPGCLNYSLVLSVEQRPGLAGIHASYRHILGRLAHELRVRGVIAVHEGISDLAVDGMKVSGNAQKRRRRSFLHHGTLLHEVDATAMRKYLREPKDRPDYRGDRDHEGFVGAIRLSPATLREVVRTALDVDSPPVEPTEWELAEKSRLVMDKYRLQEWIHRR